MNTHLKSIICLLAAIAGPGLFCAHDGQLSGIEVTNGDCTGTIYHQDSTVAPGAVVRLIPADYNPQVPATGQIDSTTTDDAGRYAFDVAKADVYNIIAEKDGASSISEAVPLQPAASVVVNDTLRASGNLAGKISVKPGDDARNVIILVWGTNVYTTPTGFGTFATPPLPAGTFTVKIVFIGGDEYAQVDTSVTILPGQTTDLFVTLTSTNAPPITGFSMQYDSATMNATLTWQMVDTSKIVSYALYRTDPWRHDTTMMINKSASSYIDDVILFEGGTVTYTIVAIGKNFKEGYRSNTEVLLPHSTVDRIKTITVHGCPPWYWPEYQHVDQNGNFIFSDGYTICKVDSNGALIKQYTDTHSETHSFFENLQADNEDCFYGLDNYCDSGISIIKFDNDLNILSKFTLRDSLWFKYGEKITLRVSGNGTLFLFVDMQISHISFTPLVRHTLVYDPYFNKKYDSLGTTYLTSDISIFGDTVIIYGQSNLTYYDLSMSETGIYNDSGFLSRHDTPFMVVNQSTRNYITPLAAPGGLVFYNTGINTADEFTYPFICPLLMIGDRKKHLLCRRLLPEFNTDSDFKAISYGAGCFYTRTRENSEFTITKYSMQRLKSVTDIR